MIVKLRMLKNQLYRHQKTRRLYTSGETFEIDGRTAEGIVNSGMAEYVEPAELAPPPPEEETEAPPEAPEEEGENFKSPLKEKKDLKEAAEDAPSSKDKKGGKGKKGG